MSLDMGGLDELPPSGGNFKRVPPGRCDAFCVGLLDLGQQEVNYAGETKLQRKLLMIFEVHGGKDYQTDDGKPLTIYERCTRSTNEKAKLTTHLKSWCRVAAKDCPKFPLKSLLGKPCELVVEHNPGNNGKTHANITTILEASKHMNAECVNDPVFISLNPKTFDRKAFEGLSEKLQEIIKRSPEYKEIERLEKKLNGYASSGDPRGTQAPLDANGSDGDPGYDESNLSRPDEPDEIPF